MKRTYPLAILLWSLVASVAWPSDQIYLSTRDRAMIGKITAMTPTAIVVQTDGASNEVPANEIKRIIFEGSPASLTEAQRSFLYGQYDKTVDSLTNETIEDKRPEIAQEIAFLRAYSAAQLTLSGDFEVKEAGQQVAAFLKDYPTSFHYFKACEEMGDLCARAGRFAAAQQYYAKLNQAPWPEYQIRAQVALGRACLAQGDVTAADKAFDDALMNFAPGAAADDQRTAATIGKASCMVVNGNTDAALRSLNRVMEKMDDRNQEISAMAYNALGAALRKAGKPEKAMLAFLRVHLMYDLQSEADAEAVANLERLFIETHRPQHAQDMRNILNDRYKNSHWANGVK